MRERLKAENNDGLPFVLGITDRNTVKLDFDNTPFKTVRYWASRTMKWFNLKGFMILKSNKGSYHVVFDRKVSWRKNMHIVAWVCLLSQNRNLQKWFIMQCIKEGSTLRVSAKKEKPEPRIVFRCGSQEKQIAEFLAFRTLIKNIVRNLQKQKELCSPLSMTKS